MKEEIRKLIICSIESISGRDASIDVQVKFNIEIPKNKKFGDFSTNIAMVLSKSFEKSPREIAELIIENLPLDSNEIIKKTEIAGPGFINFFVKEKSISSKLNQINDLDREFGSSNLGNQKRVLLEYVSANPTGILHLGHARNAVVGGTLANILSFAGYDVTKEFYINDTGRQIELLGLSVFSRYKELFGEESEIPEDGYKGIYVIEIAEHLKNEVGDKLLNDSLDKAIDYCSDFAKAKMIDEIREDLKSIGVEFDSWFSEKNELYSVKEGDSLVDRVKKKLSDIGALEKKDGAVWFKSTSYGDSQDWVLIRKDGTPTYFLGDITYHYEKYERGYKGGLINIWGADHHSHVNRLKIAVKALGFDETLLKVLLIQFVRLMSEGKEVSMSKRAGSYVTLREVAAEVGIDVMRYFLIMRSSDSHLDFDLDLAKKESNENPVYYVQYAHARIGSVFENAKKVNIEASNENLSLLNLNEEIEIIKKLLEFPEIVRDCALSFSPHKLAFYLQDIASLFHVYYNRVRIIGDDSDLTKTRLFLIKCIRIVIGNGLTLLGIASPDRM
ncbi:MAG: arginine--tRNA ligase [Thermodesulfobacteriota bacterium]